MYNDNDGEYLLSSFVTLFDLMPLLLAVLVLYADP